MMRWYFNGRVPVIQINDRGRYQGFRDPGMDWVRDHAGLYVAREPDNRLPLWDTVPAQRQPLERVERVWRGVVMDTYALEKLTGWTPELAPPPDTPLFRWRVLAANTQSRKIAAATDDRDKQQELGATHELHPDHGPCAVDLRARTAG
jgi:hypothetical protein